MADPQHIPILDSFDRGTVRLYRMGLLGAAIGLVGAVALQAAWAAGFAVQDYVRPLWMAVSACTALAVAHVHLYAKVVRWIIAVAAWTGLVLQASAGLAGGELQHWLYLAGLGFLFVSLSALALKEQFCFRIPGLRLVPLFLAGSLIPLVGRQPGLAAIILAPGAALYLVLTLAKLRMPLHFDVGDKSRYEI